jgi:hypothetical protein
MNQSFLALSFQEAASDNQMLIIVAVVLVILFFIVVIVVVGLAIFFIMRKRKKDQAATAQSDLLSPSTGPSDSAYAGMSQPETAEVAQESAAVPPFAESASYESPAPSYESPAPVYESPAPAYESPATMYESPAPVYEEPPQAASTIETALFDPSRTVAIIRENTVPISYGKIRFTSGVLTGQEFQVEPEGSYIGRESTLSQIVVSDPRISKRHLWIGVRDGVVKIADQDSRNGTFVNDPKSERITETALKSGDTVILGESDVARFEYQG